MKIKKLSFPKPEEERQRVIFDFQKENCGINFGTVFLSKGIRIPEKGFTRHPQCEISYIQVGKIQIIHPDGSFGGYLESGDVVRISPNEPQAGIVMEDTKIIYVLIG